MYFHGITSKAQKLDLGKNVDGKKANHKMHNMMQNMKCTI